MCHDYDNRMLNDYRKFDGSAQVAILGERWMLSMYIPALSFT